MDGDTPMSGCGERRDSFSFNDVFLADDPPSNPRDSIYGLYLQSVHGLQADVADGVSDLDGNAARVSEEHQPLIEQKAGEAKESPLPSTSTAASNLSSANLAALHGTTEAGEGASGSGLGNSDGDKTGVPGSPKSIASDATEPFPDYYESVENNPPDVDKAREEAYNYAISKVVEEIIKFGEVDESITSIGLPPFSVGPTDTHVPNGPSMITLQPIQPCPVRPCPEPFHHNHVCMDREFRKHNKRKEIQALLLQCGDLRTSLQKRFTALSNMVIEMEFYFFRKHGFQPDPLAHMNRIDLLYANRLAAEMVNYLSGLGSNLFEEKKNAYRVRHVVGEIASEENVPVLTRFKRMAQIVIQYTSKPRFSERHLLGVFFEFFYVFFYDDFLSMYNSYLAESYIPPPRLLNTSHLLDFIMQILDQAMDDYAEVIEVTEDIRRRFILPALNQLSQGPDIWEACVLDHERQAQSEAENQHVQDEQPQGRYFQVPDPQDKNVQVQPAQDQHAQGQKFPVQRPQTPYAKARHTQGPYSQVQPTQGQHGQGQHGQAPHIPGLYPLPKPRSQAHHAQNDQNQQPHPVNQPHQVNEPHPTQQSHASDQTPTGPASPARKARVRWAHPIQEVRSIPRPPHMRELRSVRQMRQARQAQRAQVQAQAQAQIQAQVRAQTQAQLHQFQARIQAQLQQSETQQSQIQRSQIQQSQSQQSQSQQSQSQQSRQNLRPLLLFRNPRSS